MERRLSAILAAGGARNAPYARPSARHKLRWGLARQITGSALLKHACLAACYAQLGRDGEARAAVAEALELARTELATQPGAEAESLRTYLAAMFNFQNPTGFEHLVDGLRRAGLPT